MFAETMGGRQYLVIGIDRLGSSSGNTARYHADPSKSNGRYWVKQGIEHISAYTNKTDGANTIFASGGGKLTRLTRASRTNTKVWRSQEITLAAPPDQKPLSFNSYTTTIIVNSKDGLPASDVELEISADSYTPFYINGLYYLVGQTPVIIPTDAAGTVTIIEASNDLNATVLTVAIPNDVLSTIIDAMNYAFRKISSLDSESALRDASYPTLTAVGGTLGDPGYSPLVSSSANQGDLQVIASRMTNLKDVWANVKPPSTTPLRRLKPTPS
ncbi:hypothetical protein DL766_006320 [Monosporascus sp. MC13-8B]|uniref:Uncharacterized protein n=1 Tax=Monosporascus cannonballus TaxID=155416 RepID=A0ABY0GVI3_9PEZI|nr:hypothetical protein DL762_008977 [Monosporascus cannonballus]RYP27594.1 hypothetical protein DL766_006320 [Monosporascus sp. MC13-8B]